jgi:hypothetical protein
MLCVSAGLAFLRHRLLPRIRAISISPFANFEVMFRARAGNIALRATNARIQLQPSREALLRVVRRRNRLCAMTANDALLSSSLGPIIVGSAPLADLRAAGVLMNWLEGTDLPATASGALTGLSISRTSM